VHYNIKTYKIRVLVEKQKFICNMYITLNRITSLSHASVLLQFGWLKMMTEYFSCFLH